MRVYTIGHGERKLEEFLDLLCRYGVTHLVDVRPKAVLAQSADYEPENIKVELLVRGIMYASMSSSLGRAGGDFKRMQEDEEYRAGIQKLLQVVMAPDRVVCLMGVDQYPERCHRCRLIGESLTKLRVDVEHIENDAAIPQTLVMKRLAEQSYLEI